MTSIDDGTATSTPTNTLILPNIIYPVLEQLDKSGYKDIQSDMRTTFFKLEELYPGFSRTFLQSFINKEMPSLSTTTNMNELTLKLEKYCDKSSYFISSSRSEQEFHELNIRSKNLKRILSRIPDDINEKREFLETIKEIASAIKKTLDSVSNTYQYFKTADGRQALENEKKEFIKYSKNFSNTLKAYFRDSKRDDVYIAANHLLVQTDYLLRTIKLYCETDTLDECLYPLLSHHQNQLRTIPSSRYSSNNNNNNQQHQNSRQSSSSSNNRPASSYETSYT
jgi:programmed cell death protein 10